MTVSTFYSETSDGWIESSNASAYATARAGGTLTLYAGDSLRIGDDFQGGTAYRCMETFLNFNTAAIPDTDVITDPVLSLYGQEDACWEVWTAQVRLRDWGDTLATGDWVPGADLSALPLLAHFDVDNRADNFVKDAYNDFTSEAAFLTNINKTGFTRLVIHRDGLATNTAPGAYTYIQAWDVEKGTVYRPKLVVTHTAASTFMPRVILL